MVGHQRVVSSCTLAWKGRGGSPCLFTSTVIPSRGLHPHNLSASQKPYLLTPRRGGYGALT